MKVKSPLTLRKLMMLLAVVALLVSLAACNKTSSDTPTDPDVSQNETVGGTEADDATDPAGDDPTDAQVPDETAPDPVMGTVTHDNLNVRSNPSTDSTVLTQLDINDRVVIIEQRVVGDVTWGRIADGWINMNYVLLDGEDPTPETEPAETPTEPAATTTKGTTGTITASQLNIRKSNSADSASVGKYKKGDKVEILEIKGSWGRTDKGWISMKYVDTNGTTTTPNVTDDKDTDKDTDKTDTTSKEYKTLVTDGKKTVLGYVVVDISSLNVRYGPGTKYASLGMVKEGERLAYYQEKNGWVRIKNGWISKAYTDEEEPLSDKEASTLVTDGKTAVLGTVEIDAEVLNVRYGPSTRYDKSGSVKDGEKYDYYQEKDGWIRIKDGWISKAYTDKAKEVTSSKLVTDGKTTVLGYAVVTGTSLNTRYGPGTDHGVIDSLEKGDRVAYYQQDGKWIRTKEGWISTNYAYIEGTTGTGAGSGSVTGEGVNVRSGPGTGYKSVDKMNKGDKVTIKAQIKVGNTTWGYTGKGWISMQYVKLS